jgi:hypothetical protein
MTSKEQRIRALTEEIAGRLKRNLPKAPEPEVNLAPFKLVTDAGKVVGEAAVRLDPADPNVVGRAAEAQPQAQAWRPPLNVGVCWMAWCRPGHETRVEFGRAITEYNPFSQERVGGGND